MCNGCGMPTGYAYSSGHLAPSHLGFAYVLLVETNLFPEFDVIFADYTLRTSLGTFSIYAYSKGLRVCKELHDKLSSICIYKETCGYINTHMYIIDLQIQA